MFAHTLLLCIGLTIVGCNASPNSDPHFVDDRQVVTHLMEWKYSEIAKECEIFLGPYGFGGVQLSPVHECANIDRRPWWERYQPVSYKIDGRSGNEQQFADMVKRCNKVGVRIYVDVVLNHMTGVQTGIPYIHIIYNNN
jgi:alpha-amylase